MDMNHLKQHLLAQEQWKIALRVGNFEKLTFLSNDVL